MREQRSLARGELTISRRPGDVVCEARRVSQLSPLLVQAYATKYFSLLWVRAIPPSQFQHFLAGLGWISAREYIEHRETPRHIRGIV
jgi:hypothetical protein